MSDEMDLPTVLFASAAIIALLLLLWIDSRRLFRRKDKGRSNSYTPYTPKALIIVPCKGRDITLYQNLKSLKNQDYPEYDLVAVVDSEADESLKQIRRLRLRYIVSEVRAEKASGKVKAIAAALERFRDYDAYAIADSDITVSSAWLRTIVAPLKDRDTGISTMFPYFNPMRGFWSKVKMVWGFVGQNLLENEESRFAWGGSMAFRKALAGRKELAFLKNSRYSVSDDVCMTIISRRKGLRIAYTDRAQPVVNADDGFMEFIEWSNRQTALTLLGYGSNFRRGMFFYCTEIFAFISGVFLSISVSPAFILLFIHLLVSEARGYRRARSSDPAIALIVILMPFIYVYNLITARFMKRITWRGSEYSLYN